jgi:hypothetical protein
MATRKPPRNPQDLTLRNARAAKGRIDKHEIRLRELEKWRKWFMKYYFG